MVEPLARSLADSTDRARLLFVVSAGDVSVLDEVHGAHDYLLVDWWERGDYPRKINAGIAATHEPLVFTGAIDLMFHAGWLEAAEEKMVGGVKVVGTNDLSNSRVMAGQHATHMLVARDYAEGPQIDNAPGFFHESYWHEYCDDEAVAVARHRGVWGFAADSVVEHLAWQFGKRPADRLDSDYGRRMIAGRKLFRSRRHLWT
jgi:hypothetical protein